MLWKLLAVAVGCLAVVAAICAPARAASPDLPPRARPLITQPIDERNLVTLKGNTRPEANARNDRGRVPDDFPLDHMLLQLRRSPEQEQALRRSIDELHDPKSPNFRKWLAPEKFGELYGLAQQDLDAITDWLQSKGFTVGLVYPNRILIDFSGTVGLVREAFHTEIHNLEVNGAAHIANMSDPRIPAALAPAVAGVVSLHDFKPQPMFERRAQYTFAGSCGLSSECYAVTPADLATIYNFTPLFNEGISGQGMTIAVIEDSDMYSTSDWTTFRQTFGLSGYTSGSLTTFHPGPIKKKNGPVPFDNCPDPGTNGDDFEVELDAEYASAAAPSANIVVVSCPAYETTPGFFMAAWNEVNYYPTNTSIMSVSYGIPETMNGAALNEDINSLYQQAVSEGISVFVASGDSGADLSSHFAGLNVSEYGFNVNGFASTPYNVAVGGTDFSDTYWGTNSTYWGSTNATNYGSAKSYIPEIPWNDSCGSWLIEGHVGGGDGLVYGSNGFCNVASGAPYVTIIAASAGGSGCATGTPSTSMVVSGTCQGYAVPSWQVPFTGSGGQRWLPDVSLFAANGVWGHYYIVCYSDPAYGGVPCTGAPSGWSGGGGTSFAAPIMAGIQALVNQRAGGESIRWGNPNPAYYAIAYNEYYNLGWESCSGYGYGQPASSCIFYSVDLDNMDVPCGTNPDGLTYNCYKTTGKYGALSQFTTGYDPAYPAYNAEGWTPAAGLGSVNAYNLVNAMQAYAP